MIEKTMSSSTITKDDSSDEGRLCRGPEEEAKSTKQRREILNQVGMDLSKDAQAQKLAYNIGLKRLSHDLDVWPGKIEQIGEYSKESNIIFANLQHGRN
nr:hypothetical protein Iba_chr12cCG7470 [Ipomoea batatas]GMD72129.1 hypothetical protein Iba_chr12fCG5610 [Ipomoea batatas]